MHEPHFTISTLEYRHSFGSMQAEVAMLRIKRLERPHFYLLSFVLLIGTSYYTDNSFLWLMSTQEGLMYGDEGHISFLSPPNGPVIALQWTLRYTWHSCVPRCRGRVGGGAALPVPAHRFWIERARLETRLSPLSTLRQNTSKSCGKAVSAQTGNCGHTSWSQRL